MNDNAKIPTYDEGREMYQALGTALVQAIDAQTASVKQAGFAGLPLRAIIGSFVGVMAHFISGVAEEDRAVIIDGIHDTLRRAVQEHLDFGNTAEIIRVEDPEDPQTTH